MQVTCLCNSVVKLALYGQTLSALHNTPCISIDLTPSHHSKLSYPTFVLFCISSFRFSGCSKLVILNWNPALHTSRFCVFRASRHFFPSLFSTLQRLFIFATLYLLLLSGIKFLYSEDTNSFNSYC